MFSCWQNRLLQTFASPFAMESESVMIKVSIGIVHVSNEQDFTVWLRNSSIALSNAKQDKSPRQYLQPGNGERF